MIVNECELEIIVEMYNELKIIKILHDYIKENIANIFGMQIIPENPVYDRCREFY